MVQHNGGARAAAAAPLQIEIQARDGVDREALRLAGGAAGR